MSDYISRQQAIKDAESWVAVDEYEKHLQKNVVEWLKEFPSAEHGTNLAEDGTDLISRAAAQTELQLSARRYTVAHEAHGEGRVVWSEDLISVSDAMDVLRKIPSAQPTFDARDTQYNLPIGTDVPDINVGELISRQAAIDTLENTKTALSENGERYIAKQNAIMRIDALPSAQPKRGKWERHYSRPNVYADLCWHCSECGYSSSDNWADKFNFCPNCGADMRGEQDG